MLYFSMMYMNNMTFGIYSQKVLNSSNGITFHDICIYV